VIYKAHYKISPYLTIDSFRYIETTRHRSRSIFM